jgi:ribose 5-phosphate isomerase A
LARNVTLDDLKQQAALHAVEFVHSHMVVGLGSGSTAVYATRAIGRLLEHGRLHDIVAIPTSQATAHEAEQLGIPLTTLSEHPEVDITIDGADEIDPHLNLIKGLGGALLREKIVESVSKQLIIIADDRKLVEQLGSRSPVPVEVIPFAQQPVTLYLQSLGARVELRAQSGDVFFTDEGNILLDCYFDPIGDAQALAQAIRQQPGVVEHGLFLGMATHAVVAAISGVRVLHANV